MEEIAEERGDCKTSVKLPRKYIFEPALVKPDGYKTLFLIEVFFTFG